jgi:phenylacetate-CoA ligase
MKVPYHKVPLMIYQLQRNFKRSPQDLQRYQNERLRAIVKHCAERVPYYHDLFKARDLDPSMIRTVDDLTKLPILTKNILRAGPVDQFVAQGVDVTHCMPGFTSGTSGIPLTLYYTKDAYLDAILRDILLNLRMGDSLFHRRLETTPWVPLLHPVLQRLGIYHTRYISPLEDLAHQLHVMREFQPHTLLALPSSALILAKELQDQLNMEMDVNVIFTIGELVDRGSRAMIQETFDAELYDRYGSAEVGRVSTECEEHVYHIQKDMNVMEVLKDGARCAAGEVGEIVVTNLTNYAMPMLRYNLEDLGAFLEEMCSCDLASYPLMRLATGRMIDFIILPDGRRFPAHEVAHTLHAWRYRLKQFQVIQTARDNLSILLVEGIDFLPSMIEDIRHEFANMLGPDIEITIGIVDEIPREKSGKFKAFKSQLPR